MPALKWLLTLIFDIKWRCDPNFRYKGVATLIFDIKWCSNPNLPK